MEAILRVVHWAVSSTACSMNMTQGSKLPVRVVSSSRR